MEMFCCKLKFVVDICNNWIYQKFTKQRVFLDSATKEQNPLNFKSIDFVIKKEQRFLQNNFSKEEILSSETICNLKNLL